MKIKKGLGVLAVLLALTLAGCNAPAKEPSEGGEEQQQSQEQQSSSAPSKTSSQQPKITITAADGKKTLEIGDTVQLSSDVDGVTWSTSNADAATVSDGGLVTAVAPGSATIKAAKDGYKDGSISITVNKPAAPHPAEPTWPETCPDLIDTTDWVAGTPAQNSYGKDCTPLTATDGSVGVKIAMTDYNPNSVGSYESDGSIQTKNESTAYVSYNVKAPKAGIYQMILKASISSSNTDRTFSSRGFDVKVNGYEDQDNIYGDRIASDAGLDSSGKNYFVFALVQLSGPEYEDEISFRNHNYRLRFDTNVDLIFAENK